MWVRFVKEGEGGGRECCRELAEEKGVGNLKFCFLIHLKIWHS